jgi:hypothetical protein
MSSIMVGQPQYGQTTEFEGSTAPTRGQALCYGTETDFAGRRRLKVSTETTDVIVAFHDDAVSEAAGLSSPSGTVLTPVVGGTCMVAVSGTGSAGDLLVPDGDGGVKARTDEENWCAMAETDWTAADDVVLARTEFHLSPGNTY